jgi:hypothetical protein
VNVDPNRKEELERRLERSRRLSKDASDPTTKERLDKLTRELEALLEKVSRSGAGGAIDDI